MLNLAVKILTQASLTKISMVSPIPIGVIPISRFSSKPEQKEYQKVVIKPEDLEFNQVKGGGPGGQSVNKTNNCVVLKHRPTGIIIKSHSSRDTETNRHYAIKQLKEKLDELTNGPLSKKSQAADRKRKQDSKRRKRSLEKYQSKDTASKETSDEKEDF